MKHYLVFAYDAYYPCGGWNDFQASFDTLEEAKAYVDGPHEYNYGFWSVIDSFTGKEVEIEGSKP